MTRSYSPTTGRPNYIKAGPDNSILNMTYLRDEVGNVVSRSEATQNLLETFIYDDLNRLTTSTVNSSGAGVITKTYAYDEIGNRACSANNSVPRESPGMPWSDASVATPEVAAVGIKHLPRHSRRQQHLVLKVSPKSRRPQIAAAAVAGGTASVIGDGKFRNAAIAGAYGYI